VFRRRRLRSISWAKTNRTASVTGVLGYRIGGFMELSAGSHPSIGHDRPLVTPDKLVVQRAQVDQEGEDQQNVGQYYVLGLLGQARSGPWAADLRQVRVFSGVVISRHDERASEVCLERPLPREGQSPERAGPS